jgi:hypothetical protein
LCAHRIGKAKDALFSEADDIVFRRGGEGRILSRHGLSSKIEARIERRKFVDLILAVVSLKTGRDWLYCHKCGAES